MKERGIHFLDSSSYEKPQPKLAEANKAFFDSETLTDSEVTKIAENIAEEIREELKRVDIDDQRKREFILDILRPKHIFQNDFSKWKTENPGKQYVDNLPSDEELEQHLQKLRITIVEKVTNILLSEGLDINFVKEEIKNGLMELGDENLFKDYRLDAFDSLLSDEEFIELTERDNKNRIEALKILHSLPVKSPYIYYGTQKVDVENGATIIQKASLTTVGRAIFPKKDMEPSFDKFTLLQILSFLAEIIRGHKYLLENGLILSDNHLDNLGIDISDENNPRGVLFDFGGLRKKGERSIYSTAESFYPPERGEEDDSPATEKNIVFELGQDIRKILEAYDQACYGNHILQEEFPANLIGKLGRLWRKMLNSSIENRLNMTEVQQQLEEILHKVN